MDPWAQPQGASSPMRPHEGVMPPSLLLLFRRKQHMLAILSTTSVERGPPGTGLVGTPLPTRTVEPSRGGSGHRPTQANGASQTVGGCVRVTCRCGRVGARAGATREPSPRGTGIWDTVSPAGGAAGSKRPRVSPVSVPGPQPGGSHSRSARLPRPEHGESGSQACTGLVPPGAALLAG